MNRIEEVKKILNNVLGMCSERSPRWRAVVLELEALLLKLDEPQPLTDEERLLTPDELAHLKAEYIDPDKETETRTDIANYVYAVRDAQDAKTATLLQQKIEQERKEVGEWLLDEYEATPQDKRIALFETVIEKLIAGQSLNGDKEGE